jgi:cell division septal protein FtsQ
MKLLLLISLVFLSSCSNQNVIDSDTITFETSKERILDIDDIKIQIINHLLNKNSGLKSDFFSTSWISSIRTTRTLDNILNVQIKEHQPIASLGRGKFITQEGKIIFSKERTKLLELMSIRSLDSDSGLLLNYAFLLQNILNLKDNSVVSFEHIGSNFIESYDNQGTKYSFTIEDFRVQLERLEQFILFELNSGNDDHIRYIDLRYKNAIAVSTGNLEKLI